MGEDLPYLHPQYVVEILCLLERLRASGVFRRMHHGRHGGGEGGCLWYGVSVFLF